MLFIRTIAREQDKFIDLNLEYTANQEEVAVIQICFKQYVLVFQWEICFKQYVLVFQWARSEKQCQPLMDFLPSGIHFASVDITNDKIKMKRTWGLEIPSTCHIDLQAIFRLEHPKTGKAAMASALIDEDAYKNMKKRFKSGQHDLWEKYPLGGCNIEYAAKDVYVAYEVYRKIRIINYGQRHLVPRPVRH